jgi:hypothetical protein
MKRPFLISLGVAVGALTPSAAALSEKADSTIAADNNSANASANAGQPGRASLLALPGAASAQAATRLLASLTVGQTVPYAVNAGLGARGSFNATLNGRVLHWRMTFVSLSSDVVAAVLHRGTRGHVGGRIGQICGRCVSPAYGVYVLTASQAAETRAGRAYINVGTKILPHGEIRGQIHRPQASYPPAYPPPTGHLSHMSHVSHSSHASHSSHVSHYSSA